MARSPHKASAGPTADPTGKARGKAEEREASRSSAIARDEGPSRAVSPEAEELARLVVLQARESEVAGVLATTLPEVMQTIMDNARARGSNPATTAAQSMLFRLMRHPAASSAAPAGGPGALVGLRDGIAQRLNRRPVTTIEGVAAQVGRSAVTAAGTDGAEPLPF